MNVANPRCFAALLLLCGPVEFALAEGPQQLVVSRPFVQVKTTDAAGNVSYRVGGVFTEGADPANHRAHVDSSRTTLISDHPMNPKASPEAVERFRAWAANHGHMLD